MYSLNTCADTKVRHCQQSRKMTLAFEDVFCIAAPIMYSKVIKAILYTERELTQSVHF